MRWVVAAVAILLAGLAVPVGADNVSLDELVLFTPWDAIYTIREPRFDDELYVGTYEEVIGLAWNGEAHAYPIKVMNWHEVVDDVVGGLPVVVSYCPLCGTAIAYERNVSGRVLTFGSSGYLYRNNKVLFDDQTGSLWPQILGEAINGTYHGTRLVPVSTSRMAFIDWVQRHPNTGIVGRPWGPVLCPDPCRVPFGFHGYAVNPYDGDLPYDEDPDTLAEVRYPDLRLHPKTFVVGIVREGDAWAIPVPVLQQLRAVHENVGGLAVVVAWFQDPDQPLAPGSAQVYASGGRTFTVDADANELVADDATRFDITTGTGDAAALERVPYLLAFWFAWHDVHPRTRIYGLLPRTETLGIAVASGLLLVAIAVVVSLDRRHSRVLNKTR